MSDARQRPPALVIGGDDNGLSVARSLGRRGIPVHALGCSVAVGRSRFARSIPPDQLGGAARARQPEAWLDWLLGRGTATLAGSALLPCNDAALELVARNRRALEAHYLLGEADSDAVLAMLDKLRTYELATGAAVPAPRVWAICSRSDLVAVLPELPYPCALKPRHSHLFQRHFEVKLLTAGSEAELLRGFDEAEKLGLEMLVTEIIPGADDQYLSYWTYIPADGKPLFQFTKRKSRQYPIHFGMGTFHVSEWNAEVAELGLRFLRSAGLKGIGIVEFKRDSRDGGLKLMECNARFTKANEIVVRSGIDLPLLVYNHVTGRPLPQTGGFREGVRLWFPLEDWKAFRAYRAHGELTLVDWLLSLCHRWHFTLFHWSDPWPAVAYAGERLLSAAQRTVSGRRPAEAQPAPGRRARPQGPAPPDEE